MLHEVRVAHSQAGGVVVQLPSGAGFGKVTRESLGGDALADRMLQHYLRQDTIPVTLQPIPQLVRDHAGFAEIGCSIFDLTSSLSALKPAVRSFIATQFRKHALVGIAQVHRGARVTKSSKEGAVLKLNTGFPAVTFHKIDENIDSVDCVLLDYDPDSGVANVSADVDAFSSTIEASAVGTPVAGRTSIAPELGLDVPIHFGMCISCVVLLRKQHYIVVRVGQVIGYVLPKSGTVSAKVRIGDEVNAYLVYLPAAEMTPLTPFVVLSDAKPGHVEPTSRLHRDDLEPVSAPFRGLRPDEVKSDDDSEDSDEDEPKMRRRKLEETIDALERQGQRVPSSPEEFVKVLIAAPNNSFLWTQYIAYHVGQQQIEAARLVAEKALKTIGVRESTELRNVWVAYMNLENNYGTVESLTTVFKRALQHSDDPLIVYMKLADIFDGTKKPQQLLDLCRSMVGKFPKNPAVWERYCKALVSQGKRDQLRRVLKDMGKILLRANATLVLEHIAIFEYKSGTPEYGRALMENLVLNAGKKSDVWFAYIDQEQALLRKGDSIASAEHIRAVFERAASLALPPKSMQALLTKYIAFAQAHGTPADVEAIKKRAREYVESKIAAMNPIPVAAKDVHSK